MEILQNILLVVHVIVCILLTVVVLLQTGNSSGLSGTISGGADTFFGQNKGKTIDAVLGKVTAFLAVLMLIITIALTVTINQISKSNAAELQNQLNAAAESETVEINPEELDVEAPAEPEADVVEGEEAPVVEGEEAPVVEGEEAPAEPAADVAE